MSRIIETEVFQFDELSERAKEKAREWCREGALDYDWWDSVYEDAATCGKIMGIDIKQKPVKLMNGNTRYDPSIWFNGFGCQGQGCAYDASYAYVRGSRKAIRKHAPQDRELHAIADALFAIQRRHFYRLTAEVKSERDTWIRVHVDWPSLDCVPREAEEIVTEALRDFNHWIFCQLQREHDWLLSDEQVDESIRANEYEFNEDGSRA